MENRLYSFNTTFTFFNYQGFRLKTVHFLTFEYNNYLVLINLNKKIINLFKFAVDQAEPFFVKNLIFQMLLIFNCLSLENCISKFSVLRKDVTLLLCWIMMCNL